MKRGLAIAALVACGKQSASFEWHDFHGMEYRTPAGTTVTETDGTLPGPGGRGGVPSGESPRVVLSKPKGFHVEILNLAERPTLEGTKYALETNGVGWDMVGQTTSTGFRLTYVMASGKAHVVYEEIAGRHFQCTFADATSPDRAAAEAICLSMRPKK